MINRYSSSNSHAPVQLSYIVFPRWIQQIRPVLVEIIIVARANAAAILAKAIVTVLNDEKMVEVETPQTGSLGSKIWTEQSESNSTTNTPLVAEAPCLTHSSIYPTSSRAEWVAYLVMLDRYTTCVGSSSWHSSAVCPIKFSWKSH